jgi:hypothetical protein
MNMTYNLCKKLIALGKLTANMLDVYYAAGRLTDEQYTELMTLLTA